MDYELDGRVRGKLAESMQRLQRFSGYSEPAMEKLLSLDELVSRFYAGESGMRTHFHGRQAVAMKYLVQTGTLPEDSVRARYVLIDNYNCYMIGEYRNGSDWVLFDAGRQKEGFHPDSRAIRSWDAMEKIDPAKLMKSKRRIPETSAMTVMTCDLIAATAGPFQPWEHGYRFMVGNRHVDEATSAELYRELGREMGCVLERGISEEMQTFRNAHHIRLG